MKRLILLFVIMFIEYSLIAQPVAWVNEIHYDNEGNDANESIEIVIKDVDSYTLSDFSVVLYNGNTGTSYSTESLSDFTKGNSYGDFSFYYFTYPANGIQNGIEDGIALAYQNSLIQFLSYEGTLTGVGGIADGSTSTDIGVLEDGSTSSSKSLQLTGSGNTYADFSWLAPANSTYGNKNNAQFINLPTRLNIISVVPSSPEIGETFVLTVQAQDDVGDSSDVSSDETVTLSLSSGTGALGGTLIGTITAGTNKVVFSNLTYDVVETMQISAYGSSLTGASLHITVKEVIPIEITNAYYTPDGIIVEFNKDASSFVAGDFTLNPGGIIFSTLTLVSSDLTNKTILLSGESSNIVSDIVLDQIVESVNSSTYEFYAGIIPIMYTNSANSPDTILTNYNVTLTGVVIAMNGFGDTWIQDAAGGKNGVYITDYDQIFE